MCRIFYSPYIQATVISRIYAVQKNKLPMKNKKDTGTLPVENRKHRLLIDLDYTTYFILSPLAAEAGMNLKNYLQYQLQRIAVNEVNKKSKS